MNYDSPLTDLKGIGEKSAKKFEAAGIFCLEDLITHYPRAYETYAEPADAVQLSDGQVGVIEGILTDVPKVRYAGRYQIVSAYVSAGGAETALTWFNMPYLRASLIRGKRYVFRGMVKVKGERITLTQPQVFSTEEYAKLKGRMHAVYPLTDGLTGNAVSKAVRQALDGLPENEDYLPEEIRSRYDLEDERTAIETIHFPENAEVLKRARRRLAFDEFLLFILGIKMMKQTREAVCHSYELRHSEKAAQLIGQLPYRLTDAQLRVWQQVEADLMRRQVMARLIQGDVGCGKTILAFLAMLTVADNGGQSALMVPTGVLAHQHYEAWEKLAAAHQLPFKAVLLTGEMKSRERREAYQLIETGQAKIIIGTHALFQEKVIYDRLMLVITDEQHRFGVRQREALGYKGELPHTLVMSATPIPRTLAVILYGDLDISVVNEMPAERLRIKTAVVDTGYRPKAYRFIEKQVREGHQVYVICPLVEASDADGMEETENVVDYTEVLKQQLSSDIRIQMLHGRMKQSEKDEIMADFASAKIQVLVSTTVIEVGVNVPNATVMMIEDAHRFGLAQLHQLRGRVGRGADQSYCILVYRRKQGSAGAKIPQRLNVLKESDDGFEIARKDLEMRGPGELFGVRQSGELAFQVADIFTDAPVLEIASEAATGIIEEDCRLNLEKYSNLKTKLRKVTKDSANNLNI